MNKEYILYFSHTATKIRYLTPLCLLCYILLMALCSAHTQAQQHPPVALRQAHALLNRWQADLAEQSIQTMLQSKTPAPSTAIVLARIRFYQGRYREASELITAAIPEKKRKHNDLYRAIQSALELTSKYQEAHSKHFTIAYPPGLDSLLVPYALEALEKAHDRLGSLYDYRPTRRVRIEILTDALQLAKLSPLTEADIMRTGTIALCKYNRIMITSPRALLRGYRWLDTLVHEYTHLLINHIAADIPIWLHEGLARFSETLWRTDLPKPISPYTETLLARAIKNDALIPFERMHPSMAKLPSQRDAALAYAQVYNLIDYFVSRTGRKSIPKLLRLVHKGTPLPQAFAQVTKTPFPDFLKQWQEHLRNQNLRIFNDLVPEKKVLKDHQPTTRKAKPEQRDLWYRPASPKALGERYLKLGELLRNQKRFRAALLEYLKAEKYWKNHKPHLQNKIARTYFALQQHDQAIPHLKSSLSLYPDFVTTYVHLGSAYFATKQYDQAAQYLEEAAQINPFHPLVHQYLATIYGKKANHKRAKMASRSLELLQKYAP
jgi:tetratricopeptide (TPR) repeat protein